MSRRSDRKKSSKESSVSRKDESDAATLRSSDIDATLRSSDLQPRSMLSIRSTEPSASLLPSRENSSQLQLQSESVVGSETKQPSPDCKTSILETLRSLEAKIKVLMEKSGMSNSSENEGVELQAEMTKLLQATKKQKDDFNQLHETVRRQRDMLQRMETMAKTGSLTRPIAPAIDSKVVDAVQCCHDLETRMDVDTTIVLLISGRHEHRRKLANWNNELVNVYIPESVNLGSRMLPGRQSFPNALLQSLTFDAPPKSPTTVLTPRGSGVGSELGTAVMGVARSCPVCGLQFSTSETLGAFERHVDMHFAED